MKNKKILLYIPSLNKGGAERNFVYLANFLAEQGYITTLCKVESGGDYLPLLSSKVTVITLSEENGGTLRNIVKYIRLLRHLNPSAIISTLPHANVISIFVKFLFSRKSKLILREANTPSAEVCKSLKDKLIFWLSKQLYRYADYVVGVSQGVSKDVIQTFRVNDNKVITIQNGIDVDKCLEIAHTSSHSFIFEKNVKYILSVGRLSIQKNVALLLSSLVNLDANFHLIILGDGPEKGNIQNLVEKYHLQDRVTLLGFVDNPFYFMQVCDLYILSSDYEGLPGALLQASCFDIDIVSTNCPSGPDEILNHGEYGSLVKINSSEELKAEVYKRLSNPSSKDYFERRRSYIRKTFSTRRSGIGYIELIEK
ncbi:glycosyltransferase [Vibrio splendidus]|uniref:glycosyltransferase n=1 Tax=Vibrio splendidus TaxID=29497 RepID=UPI003D0F16FB